MDERIWRLPGPRGLIRDALRELGRRRHVAIVLPRKLARYELFTDSLAVELQAALEHSGVVRRVFPDDDCGSVVETIGRALVYDDHPPVALPDLVAHPDAARAVAVVVATDLPEDHQKQFPELLRRLEAESRSTADADRLTLVAIVGRHHLPHFAGGESSDVSLASVWWWNRVTRWDAAAHTADFETPGSDRGVLGDVRAETIVEVARWDLDLAETLATSWSGDPDTLRRSLCHSAVEASYLPRSRRACGSRPAEMMLVHWDDNQLDGWHDELCPSAGSLLASPGRLARLVWAAQARILLPWIEERRASLYDRVKAVMGQRRFSAALQTLFTPPLSGSSVVEIRDLRHIIEVRVGDARLRSAARRLHHARNRLAHLEPLTLPELRELAAACEVLG